MATINKETISQISNADELIDFIATNIYKPENSSIIEKSDFNLLPDYTKNVILILDFETEYEMQGIHTLIENSVGNYLTEIATSFDQTRNLDIADCIKNILKVLVNNNLTLDKIRSGEVDNKEYYLSINEIDKKLQKLISEKEYWDNVIHFVNEKIKRGSS